MSVSTRKRQKKNLKRGTTAESVPPRIAVSITIQPPRYFARKQFVERLLAAILLVPGAFVILIAGILVRLTSRGSPIFSQQRVGKDGRVFKMYKIRTMIDGAEEKTGPTWTKPNDPRVTLLGKLLRKLHIDEFPQLINVLRGEMSLVGPRPERPEFVPNLLKKIPNYGDRLAVLPGVTGLAQINLPPDRNLEDVRRKLVLDLEYINHAGLLLDVRILLCTFVRLLGCPGVVAMHLFGLRREVPEFPDLQSGAGPSAGGNGAASRQTVHAPVQQPGGANGYSAADGNGSQQIADKLQPAPQVITNPKPR